MQTHRTSKLLRLALATALLACCCTEAYAVAKHFDPVSVPGKALPVDFTTIITYKTPSGVGSGRTTTVKVVTVTNDPAALIFQLQPKTAGTIGNRPPVEFSPGGAAQFIQENGGDVVASAVLAQVVTLADSPGSPTNPADTKLIKVTIQYDDAYNFTSQEDWSLKVKETTTTREYFGWAGDSEGEATQPSMKVTQASLDFGEVQIGLLPTLSPVKKVDVRNVGTAPLQISALPITGVPAVFSVVSTGIPPTLDPGESLPNIFNEDPANGPVQKTGLWIDARPAALGAVSPAHTLAVQTATETKNVSLTAAGVNLYAELVLDVSGSMGWTPAGVKTNDENARRLKAAKDGAKELIMWAQGFSGGQACMGLTTFPESASSAVGKVRETIGKLSGNSGSLLLLMGGETAGGLTANGTTPMESGISTARGDMTNAGHVQSCSAGGSASSLRQAMLLLSDGDENVGSNARSQITPLKNAGIHMYTIGYGDPNTATVNQQLLKDLASGTFGTFFDANALSAFDLKKKFKDAVKSWLNLRTIVDPVGTIRRGQSRSHTVCVDDTSYGITFTVDWDRHQQGGIGLTLKAPSGETITPSSADVSFTASDTFALYVIRGKRLRGGQGGGPWTLQLSGSNGLPADADTTYSYNVLVQSPMDPKSVFKENIFTLEKALLELDLGDPEYFKSRKMKVDVKYDTPAASLATYLARTPIDPAWVFPKGGATKLTERGAQDASAAGTAGRVPDTILGEPATIAQKKAYALAKLANKPFVDKRATGSLTLVDDGTAGDRVAGDGIYSATLPSTAFEGNYHYLVDVVDTSIVGAVRGCFSRQVDLSRLVAVAVNAANLTRQVTWVTADKVPHFDPRVAEIEAQRVGFLQQQTWVMVAPQDDSGNYAGLGLADRVKISIQGGEAVGPLIDNWDGTYVQAVKHSVWTRPSAVVTFGDVVSAAPAVADRPWWVILLAIVLVVLVIVIVIKLFKK